MNISKLKQLSETTWQIEPHGRMLVPAILYGERDLIEAMDDKVYEQSCNVTLLPGIVDACHVMPDAHWGYGFPIGGVAAFDAEKGGVISAGGVGFDIACGVRTLTTGLKFEDVDAIRSKLAEALAHKIPAGVGSHGKLILNSIEIDEMLIGGAAWAVENGYGIPEDLRRIEEDGQIHGAKPDCVSEQAKKRQSDQVGTLGSGNHYMEVQHVTEVFDERIAGAFGIQVGDVVISIHCGSRGLGHQIGTDFLKSMVMQAGAHGIELPDRELACAPVNSLLGQKYLGAMRSGINCAMANRQVLTHLLREAFDRILPQARLKVLYDVSHNTCKEEVHKIDGQDRKVFVHRKGATRAFGPANKDIPIDFSKVGQPVIIGGTMGTASYILAGSAEPEKAFSSSCHGAGRSMSRHEATKRWQGKDVVHFLASKGIIIKSPSFRGVAEEAPGAYKDVGEVVDAAHKSDLSVKVAKLEPMICVKG